MRNAMLAVMLIIVVMLAYRIIMINRTERTQVVKDVVWLHIAVASTTLSYAMTILNINETFALVSHGLYFWCCDFMLLLFIVYINDFTMENFRNKIVAPIIDILILLDGILCLINVFNRRLFSVKLSGNDTSGYYYKVAERMPMYLYHKGLICILCFLVVCMFSYEIYKAAKIYVKQYIAVLCCFLFTILTNVIYEVFDLEFDYSVLFYGLVAVAIYYFTFQYVPKGLVEKTLVMAVQNFSDGVICVDINGRCIYANTYARQAFHADRDISQIERYYREWLSGRKPEQIEECSWQGETDIQGETHYFVTRYRGIWDEDDRFIGCYFVLHDETEHRRRLEEERYRSNYDALTGLLNREYFYEVVEKQIQKNANVKYSILCADIQNFKIINDVFGIKQGDALLCSIAEMLLNLATGDTVISRLSADRFAVCVRNENINRERYLEEVDLVSRIGENNSYHAHIYTGICPIQNTKTPISVYCDRAFLAIETIKGNYQQSIAYYDDELRKHMLEGQHMVSEFRSAIARQEFQLYLQPLVDVEGTMLGAEALVRWFRPVHGMMMPDDFVGIFEKSGLISAMDQYVWELACKRLHKWKEEGKEQYYITVNVSPKDFYFMDIYQTLITLVECYEIDPDKLRLEITETSVMKDAGKHLALIDALREYGFHVMMDDFGKGFSSLNMLQDMNLDAIKIDMEFLKKTDNPERSQMILEMIINLSKELGIKVVTEGVEREDQLRYMRKLGCNLFQGFYFAKPMPAGQFEQTYF